jgi:hypothetical protein
VNVDSNSAQSIDEPKPRKGSMAHRFTWMKHAATLPHRAFHLRDDRWERPPQMQLMYRAVIGCFVGTRGPGADGMERHVPIRVTVLVQSYRRGAVALLAG